MFMLYFHSGYKKPQNLNPNTNKEVNLQMIYKFTSVYRFLFFPAVYWITDIPNKMIKETISKPYETEEEGEIGKWLQYPPDHLNKGYPKMPKVTKSYPKLLKVTQSCSKMSSVANTEGGKGKEE